MEAAQTERTSENNNKDRTLLGSYSQEITRTADADLRDELSMYTMEMRIRGNKVRVHSGSSYTLRFTATVRCFSGGYGGYRSDNLTVTFRDGTEIQA